MVEEGDDSDDEELRARKQMDSRLKLLEQRHHIGKARSGGGLSGDRERLFAVLEGRGAGSILRGWRRELDPDGALEIGFSEFCRAMSNMGVHVDALALFQGNSEPQSFKLEDLAPEPAALLGRFRKWVKSAFDGPAGLFAVLDPHQGGFISRESFVTGCRERASNYFTDHELQELFNCIDFDDGGSVTPDEVVFLELDPNTRASEIFKLKMRSKFQRQRMLAYTFYDDGCKAVSTKHRRAQRPWHASDFEKLPPLVCKKRVDKQQEAYKKTIVARIDFMRHIRSKYSNETRAWRRILDPDCNFRVTKSALRQYLRQHDLDIDFQDLWQGLDKDGDGEINLEELNSKVASELARFRAWAHEQFGSCAALWDVPRVAMARLKPNDKNPLWSSDKKMLIGNFAEAIRELGWRSDAGWMLYHSLDLYGCGFLSLPDFWWLDAWEPPEWLVEQPDPVALMELQTLIQVIFPQPLNAWRVLLDVDSDNQVSWTEFQNACRKVKFTGNVGAAWRALDRDVSGTISLREWDIDSAELLSSFKVWCDAHFGSVELAFKAMDRSGIGSLTLPELRSACRRLNWNGDVRVLFSCLGVSQSKDGSRSKTLLLSDIAFIDSWIDQEMLDYVAWELRSCRAPSPRGRARRAQTAASTPGTGLGQHAGDQDPHDAVNSPMASALAPPPASQSPPSRHEQLHRKYHCLAAAKRSRPTAAARRPPRSKSLPWLEKLKAIDQRYGQTL